MAAALRRARSTCCTDRSCPSYPRLTLAGRPRLPHPTMDQDYERRLLRQIVIQNENTMPGVSATRSPPRCPDPWGPGRPGGAEVSHWASALRERRCRAGKKHVLPRASPRHKSPPVPHSFVLLRPHGPPVLVGLGPCLLVYRVVAPRPVPAGELTSLGWVVTMA